MRTRIAASFLALLLIAGCAGESRDFLTAPGGGGGPIVPGGPLGGGNCGEINTGAFNVTRSTPEKYLFSYYFSAPFTGRMFVRINNYRSGGGHENQNVQFYAVRDGDGMTVVVSRPGDSCGVLADTTEIDAPLTRNAGQVTLPAGTWSFYAVHASRVECWSDTGSGSGPIDVIDSQFEWCYQ